MAFEKIEERNVIKYVFLSAITFGIYNLIYYYKIGRDINAVCEGDGKESFSYLAAVLLSPFTLGLSVRYWLYQQGQRLKVNAPRYGYTMVEGGWDLVVFSVLMVGGDYITAYQLGRHLNKIGRVYNNTGLAEVR